MGWGGGLGLRARGGAHVCVCFFLVTNKQKMRNTMGRYVGRASPSSPELASDKEGARSTRRRTRGAPAKPVRDDHKPIASCGAVGRFYLVLLCVFPFSLVLSHGEVCSLSHFPESSLTAAV